MYQPLTAFTNAIADASKNEKEANSKFNQFASARLVLFLMSTVTGYFALQKASLEWGIVAIVALVLFILLIGKQQYYKRQRNFQRHIQSLNKDEIQRLELKLTHEDTGKQYQDPTHPYLSDLDIFGEHSIYRLINRTQTAVGSKQLAKWLSAPAEIGVILDRQAAAQEMSKDLAWRQGWQATARLYKHSPQQIEALKEWAVQPLPDNLQSKLVYRWWGILALVLIAGWLGGLLPFWVIALNTVAQGIFLKQFHKAVQDITDHTYQLGQTIKAYGALFEHTQKANFENKWWKSLPGIAEQNAATSLYQLGKQFSLLDFRMNPYFLVMLGIPTLWDLHCLARLEKWKEQHKEQLPLWLHTLAEIEAMNSIAGHQFAHPSYTIPEPIWDSTITVEAVQVGHPLIHSEKRVSNDFVFEGLGKTYLITGSNMSGKSTFLRTIGSNWVLAQMGAVVCAEKFVFTPTLIFTSMRTQDSLVENTSSFYAELKRLKQLIDLSSTPRTLPIFYMLDEILKGTNSADRHLGAQALIQQLHPLTASGIVSTHDLELGEWGETMEYVTNYHFDSEVSTGKIHFDYTLKKGICKSFNASELMRMMGIQITT